jgi:hypothetical protein
MSGIRIPITGDVSGFETAMGRAKVVAEYYLGNIVTSFATAGAKMAASVGSQVFSTLQANATKALSSVAPYAIAAAAGFVAFEAGIKLVHLALDQANEQMERFIKLGADAAKSGVSVEFFQRFTEGAKGAKQEAELLAKALEHAYEAGKPQFERQTDVRKRLGEIFESGYTGEYQSQGLKIFDEAKTAEERVRGVLTAMKELQELGVQLGDVDIGERMFGAAFAEKIRTGKLQVEELLRRLDEPPKADLIREEQVQRAQALRDRIAAAKDEIDKALGVSISLEETGLQLLNTWAGILEKVAGAAGAADKFLKAILAAVPATNVLNSAINDTLRQTESNLQRRLQDGGLSTSQRRGVEEQLRTVQGRILLAPGSEAFPVIPGPDVSASRSPAPTPPRRPLELAPGNYKPDKAAAAPSSAESLDQIERFINNLEKSNGLLRVEFENLGKSNVEREKAAALIRLQAAAKEAGREPTEQEIADTLRLAEAHGRLADKIAEGRQKLEQFKELQTFAGNEIVDILDAATKKGANFADILGNVAEALKRAALQAAVLGTGPLAGLLGLSGSNGQTGGLIGLLTNGLRPNSGGLSFNGLTDADFIPGFANGTDSAPGGLALVGERGPEIVNLPRGAQVIPNHAIAAASSGGWSLQLGDTNIDARGSSMTEGQFRAILDQRDRALIAALPQALGTARKRSAI